MSELEAMGGAAGLSNFLAYWKRSGSFEKGVREAYGMTGEGFEKHWKAQTRKRYGALAVVTNVSAALGVFAIVLVPLFLARRRRDRRKLEAMRAADAAQEAAARESALQALLDSAAEPAEAPRPEASNAPSADPSGDPSHAVPLPVPADNRYPAG